MTAFSALALKPELLANLESLAYTDMTPIQELSLPMILAGKDVIGQGKTGSGKTAAFGLGLLQHLDVKRFRIQALVLCPTRELADQVAKEVRRLARTIHNIKVLTLCGGMPFGPQIGSLEHGAHIIVGTPGRIEEHVRKGTLKLGDVHTLVLDEADRMLDMGFQESLDNIIAKVPGQRQTLLFSATFPDDIRGIADRVMRDPQLATVDSSHDQSVIEQYFYKVAGDKQRTKAVLLLLQNYQPDSVIIFCSTKREVKELAITLCAEGFTALALHGDLEQRDRHSTLIQFSNNSATVLVATDVAARGLDIDAIDLVINYQLARDSEVHVHRVGRTGRAGGKGLACSLYIDKEHHKLMLLRDILGRAIEPTNLPPNSVLDRPVNYPKMVTLQLDGGKKQKVRAGDILGALTGKDGIEGKQVGKINIFDNRAYVAVHRSVAKQALHKMGSDKIKGRSFRVREINA